MEVGEKCVTTVCEFNASVLLGQEPFLHSERFHMGSFEEAIVRLDFVFNSIDHWRSRKEM